jgi:hypothetical protein
MIEVLFTKSNLPGSRWIRELTGEDVSHCAILYYDKIIHSSYWGVKKIDYVEFATHNEIVHRVEVPISPVKVLEIYDKYKNKPYDYGALLFLFIRYMALKCGIKMQYRNLWQDSGCFICSEFVSRAIIGEADSMITPYQLYEKLLQEYTI